jgi:hypothetical protein
MILEFISSIITSLFIAYICKKLDEMNILVVTSSSGGPHHSSSKLTHGSRASRSSSYGTSGLETSMLKNK